MQRQTWLLYWNPEQSSAVIDYLSNRRDDSEKAWSLSGAKAVEEGDIFLLLRSGKEPRGLIGWGKFASTPFRTADWGNEANIEFEHLSETPLILRDRLFEMEDSLRGPLSTRVLTDGKPRKRRELDPPKQGVRVLDDLAAAILEEARRIKRANAGESSIGSPIAHDSAQIIVTPPVTSPEVEMASESTSERGTARGGGFGDSENNKLVEEAAVKAVQKWYTQRGWSVVSVEKDKRGFDLQCTKESLREHAEVKGIQGELRAFIITQRELIGAYDDPHFVLWAVTSALSPSPFLCRYSGSEFVNAFRFEPKQYWATEIVTVPASKSSIENVATTM